MSKISHSSELRLCIEKHLHSYESSLGIGGDAYCDMPQYHPMADGKYLQALAVLRKSELISKSHFKHFSLEACARIKANSYKFSSGLTWGLGFQWRNLSATEPFLITSSIVTRGLLDCYRQGLFDSQLTNLLSLGEQGLWAWIRDFSVLVDQNNIALPVYSLNIREPIYNSAAYALGTLNLIDKSFDNVSLNTDNLEVIDWIRSRRIAGLGWSYSPISPIVDLLHQCYILNSLADVFGAQSVEKECAEILGQFAGPSCFVDAIRLVMGKEELSSKRDIPWLRSLGGFQLEVLPKPARLWSLGELLVLLSRLGMGGVNSEAWVRQGRLVAEMIMSRLSSEDDVEAQYPRHVMHAVHGLACYLALLRKRAQKNTNTESE